MRCWNKECFIFTKCNKYNHYVKAQMLHSRCSHTTSHNNKVTQFNSHTALLLINLSHPSVWYLDLSFFPSLCLPWLLSIRGALDSVIHLRQIFLSPSVCLAPEKSLFCTPPLNQHLCIMSLSDLNSSKTSSSWLSTKREKHVLTNACKASLTQAYGYYFLHLRFE